MAQPTRVTDQSRPAATCFERLAYRFVVGIDVEGFSRLSTLDQMRVQVDLGTALDIATGRAGLDRTTWHRQVAGDGELAVLPTTTDGLRLVSGYPGELARALGQINRTRHPAPRLRVRLAIHHGTLVGGPFGPIGRAPIVAARLLDSQVLRGELLRTEADLALIISTAIYADLVETRLDGLEPASFHPVEVTTKEGGWAAYVYRGPLPDPQ